MLALMSKGITRAAQRILPTAEAAAGCAPDCYIQTTVIDGHCYTRECCRTGSCSTQCGVWSAGC